MHLRATYSTMQQEQEERHQCAIPGNHHDAKDGQHELGQAERSEERKKGLRTLGSVGVDRYPIRNGGGVVAVENGAERDGKFEDEDEAEQPKRDAAAPISEVSCGWKHPLKHLVPLFGFPPASDQPPAILPGNAGIAQTSLWPPRPRDISAGH